MRPFFFEGGAKENNDLEKEMTHDFSSFFFHGKRGSSYDNDSFPYEKRSEEMVT